MRGLFFETVKYSDMIPGFEKIVEERIQKAQREGKFKNLSGSGKPLACKDDHGLSEELRLAYKILKNADCIPPEIELKKEIKKTEDLLAGMKETSEKYQTLKKLNFLIMKLNTMRSAAIEREMPQQYVEKLAERIEFSHSNSSK